MAKQLNSEISGKKCLLSFIAENSHLIESKDRESSVIQTGSILNSILGAHWLLFVTSAHSREVGSSKDRQPGLPGIGGGPVYRESVVKRLTSKAKLSPSQPQCYLSETMKRVKTLHHRPYPLPITCNQIEC
jgi:hypothetical protein